MERTMLAERTAVVCEAAKELGSKHILNVLWRPYVGSESRRRQIPAGTPVTQNDKGYVVGVPGQAGTVFISLDTAKALLQAGMLQ
jgi:hypothetical protein